MKVVTNFDTKCTPRRLLQYILVRDNGKQALLKYVYEDGCYRLYADNMLLGIIKKYIADYDE
ncbi:MAG: hypothetical protein KIG37_07475 [Oscillospiraceae bacterium]|nr:hypothetical protein [Oscillospiraceae bacterium]